MVGGISLVSLFPMGGVRSDQSVLELVSLRVWPQDKQRMAECYLKLVSLKTLPGPAEAGGLISLRAERLEAGIRYTAQGSMSSALEECTQP